MTGSSKDAREDADVAFIEALARMLRENDLAEIEVRRDYGEDDSLKARVSRYAAQAPAAPAAAYQPAPAAPQQAAPTPSADADPADHPGTVTSPMVGTAYLAPEPGAAAFVSKGDQVAEGQTLLIVEAMKTMNQIPAPKAGTVREVLVADGDAVEFGAPLVIVD
ncbi:biotin carboxyl carrier protein [Hasllibacter halocynthiae]|uniref:Biotin carboxyl carrier protein of acetyl-CoA carboxylase n=1 Tax=Hasllibacter halocynthiae TaxID=595589 RepID=A0A2T0X7I1_9RHOB|nr:acetyl-CoA carboxylase biotin carboxyl carrier protein [Hasllibacter halocynthiae]PRY94855.1 biotin carboxyl carrier protein [Hasllibacter halocynthiae]